MASGLGTQLTGKVGEHLVTAELARRGILATPFSGSVPGIDILAYANHVAAPIQVKAIDLEHGDSWQFDVRRFLQIEKTDTEQIIHGTNQDLDRELICIFVALKGGLGDAEFYICKYGWLQDYFLDHYKGRKVPQNIDSFHCAIWKKDMAAHSGKWSVVEDRFGVNCHSSEAYMKCRSGKARHETK